MTYCIDANALIHSWRDNYRPTVFPTFWERLSELADNGSLISSRTVHGEIREYDDALIEWRDAHADIFLEDDEPVQERVRAIYAEWPVEVDWTRKLLGADMFVIARAQVNACTVVTHENPANSPHHPKIPDACDLLGVRWFRMMDMIEELGWSF